MCIYKLYNTKLMRVKCVAYIEKIEIIQYVTSIGNISEIFLELVAMMNEHSLILVLHKIFSKGRTVF